MRLQWKESRLIRHSEMILLFNLHLVDRSGGYKQNTEVGNRISLDSLGACIDDVFTRESCSISSPVFSSSHPYAKH